MINGRYINKKRRLPRAWPGVFWLYGCLNECDFGFAALTDYLDDKRTMAIVLLSFPFFFLRPLKTVVNG
jgi:hypothetical protein